jgi:GNAT superfamily N-acetyltransferase
MISVSRADCAEDFEVVARLGDALGEWDAQEVQAYGVAPEVVLGLFHGYTSASLAAKFSGEIAKIFVARWDDAAAGCIGLDTFDDTTLELQKFYVDPEFRGKGIGKALIQKALLEAAEGHHTRIVLQTTVYMRNAISVYEAFGFVRCPQFREIPDTIKHTEVFMARPL